MALWKDASWRIGICYYFANKSERIIGVASTNIVTTDFNPLTLYRRMNENRRFDPYKRQAINDIENKMANTYHQIYLQTVFAVKYREAVIEKAWQAQLFGVIGNLINETNCKTLIVNGGRIMSIVFLA